MTISAVLVTDNHSVVFALGGSFFCLQGCGPYLYLSKIYLNDQNDGIFIAYKIKQMLY